MTVWFLFPDWTQTNTGEEDMYFLLVLFSLPFHLQKLRSFWRKAPGFLAVICSLCVCLLY